MSKPNSVRKIAPIDPAILGDLQPIDTLIYYDMPLCFTSLDAKGELQLCYAFDWDQPSVIEWLVVPITQDEVNDLAAGRVEFRKPFLGECFYLIERFKPRSFEAWRVDQVDHESLPTAGCTLNH